jgi:hypothetical protein
MWRAEMVIAQDYWKITIQLRIFDGKEEAEFIAQKRSGHPVLTRYFDRPAIHVKVSGKPVHFYDSDIIIEEISEDKFAQMGPPIDSRVPDGPQRILNALETRDPRWMLKPSDMVPSSMTLDELLDRHGNAYSLQNVAWGVQEHTQDNCRHVIGSIGDYKIVDLKSPEIERHVRQIQEFNTTRRAVPHPGFMELTRFCINCGAKNDIEANGVRYMEIMKELGGY